MALKAAIFDLDDTLYSYQAINPLALETVCGFLADHLNTPKDKVFAAIEQSRNIVHHDNQGLAASHSRLLYFQKAIEILVGYTDCKLSLTCEELFWTTFLGKIKLFPGVLECLQMLKDHKIKILVLTDLTAQIQLRKLIQLGIDKCIDWVVSSEEVGAEKPDMRMFILALAKLKVTPNEVVMIGDNFEKDCLGAKAAGIQQIIWKRHGALTSNIKVADSFFDITKILQTML